MLTSLSSSAVLGEQIYGPYGNQRYTQGTMGTDKGYTGQFQDAATGLDYYNARYYDPVMGQFLSADHVQGNVQGFDPYSYVNGNPETATDPTGQAGVCAWCSETGIAGGSTAASGSYPYPLPHPDHGCGPCKTPPGVKPVSPKHQQSNPCASGPASNNTCTYASGKCEGHTYTQCQTQQQDQGDHYGQVVKVIGLVGSVGSLVLDAIPFIGDLINYVKGGGGDLSKLFNLLIEGASVLSDIVAVVTSIIALTGLTSANWIVELISSAANAASAASKIVKGFADNPFLSAAALVGGSIINGVLAVFTGGGEDALMIALGGATGALIDGLKSMKFKGDTLGSLWTSGIAAGSELYQSLQDHCSSMSVADYNRYGC